MNVKCQKCDSRYDDADRSTICPHKLIMPAQDLERKKLAISLMEKPLRFNHMDSGPTLRIQSITWGGMIEFPESSGLVGQFAPHLFKIVEGEQS